MLEAKSMPLALPQYGSGDDPACSRYPPPSYCDGGNKCDPWDPDCGGGICDLFPEHPTCGGDPCNRNPPPSFCGVDICDVYPYDPSCLIFDK